MERLILDPTQASGTNLITNPSFETGVANWTLNEGGEGSGLTLGQDPDPTHVGAGSFAGVVNGLNNAATARTKYIWDSTASTVTAGNVYYLRALVSGVPETGQAIRLGYRDSKGGVSQTGLTPVNNGINLSTAANGRLLEGLLTVPAGITTIQLAVYSSSIAAGATKVFVVDAAMLIKSSVAVPYFDGDTIPTVPTYTVGWSGTPHASTSVLTSTRTELDITSWVHQDGINWGDAEVNAYKAKGEIGEQVLSVDYPPRPITVPMVLQDKGGTAFATVRSMVQAKAGLWQREGGYIARVLDSGKTVYADIPIAGLTLSGGWMQAHRDADPDAELRLEAIPDFYEPEELIAEAEEKTAAELIKVIPDPGGDMPARVRIEVTEKQGVDQLGLIWGFRSRNYISATTAKTAYEAEELQVLDKARKAALAGASGGTVVQHGTISTSWTPILGARIGGTVFPTHTGTNRFFARVYSTSGTLSATRLVWDVGDLVNSTENVAVGIPAASNFYVVDMGEVRLNPSPIGSHRWDWQIQARGVVGNEDFKVDKVWIVNSDEGMGVLSAPLIFAGPAGFAASYAARDEFNQTAGSLNGKTLPTGGTWTTTGAGGTADFQVGGGVVTRAIKNNSVYQTAEPPGEYPSGASRISFEWSALPTEASKALESRFRFGGVCVCSANYTRQVSGEINSRLQLSGTKINYLWQPNVRYSIFLLMIGGQYGAVWVASGGTEPSGSPDLLVPLSESGGKAGIDDLYQGSETIIRTYDDFAAWVPTPDAVAYASRSIQLTTDGMYRLDSGGTAYGPVTRVTGALPRLPAGGLENRSTELFLKASRGVLGEVPDSAIDDIATKVYAKRSWLTLPGTI